MKRVRKCLTEWRVALMLLTRLPVGRIGDNVPDLAAVLWAFPLVGILVGGVIAGSYITLHLLGLPVFLAAILALTAGLIVTGGLHEDGLADCADGFGGGKARAQKLTIMKDSQVGSFGVLALIILMSARMAALTNLPATANTIILIVTLAMISRLMMVFYLYVLPAARTNGLGNQASNPELVSVLAATVICIPALMYCGNVIVPSLITATGTALGFAWLAKRQVGGQTGDVCGACQLLSETAGWVIMAGMITSGGK